MRTPLVQCPSCSAEIVAASRFCSSCGQAVGPLSQLPTAAPQLARHISSDSIPAGGFTPGTILIDRYRIIGLLGRGGMGEVYRADDLKLGQPVALKFLPKALASDPVRRERFFAEVRITRQLAHPNICRVYDIAEFEGQHFLSMEYIDGEDLASLMKRIGYLSNEKALDIARQLAAGLAAAHDRGVLHRDLKPANIMLDGHGRVRITDFGIAIAVEEEGTESGGVLGTPAYMAPEQFAGKGATTRSDIYALGLVLYEIYGGKRAFTSTTIAELRQEKEAQTPKAPSEIRRDIDPVVERLIMRCLERDPRARPASAAQLALALPGGDPLAAALAAGETPSPELVAASGHRDGLRPAIALGIIAWLIVGSVIGIVLRERSLERQGIQAGKSPAVLVERSREFLRKAGYPDTFAASAFGFRADRDLIRYVRLSSQPSRAEHLTSRMDLFWYRESPEPLKPLQNGGSDGVGFDDPPLQLPGEVMVSLDLQGHLVSLLGMSTQGGGSAAPAPDWTFLFSEAGLDISKWTPADPQRTPMFFADARAAWKGFLSGLPDIPIQIEAAAHRGKPVSFEITGPWTLVDRAANNPLGRPFAWFIGLLLVALIGGALFFVRQNLRLGRGDRRGAMVLALANLCSVVIYWVLRAHHLSTPMEELILFWAPAGRALTISVIFWAFYIALEPFVRRRWPATLVSWTRLLSREWRDPLIGRDVLAGCGFGTVMIILDGVIVYAANTDSGFDSARLTNAMGVGWFTSMLLRIVGQNALYVLGLLCLLSFIRALFRNDKLVMLVILVFITLLGLISLRGIGLANSWTFLGIPILAGLTMFVLMRFGLLTLAVAFVIDDIVFEFPMTLQSSDWYAPATYAALAIVAAIAFYGFRTSVGGRPILDKLGAEE